MTFRLTDGFIPTEKVSTLGLRCARKNRPVQ